LSQKRVKLLFIKKKRRLIGEGVPFASASDVFVFMGHSLADRKLKIKQKNKKINILLKFQEKSDKLF
jgi:hypothetical protein